MEGCFRRKVKSFSYNNNIIALAIQEESQMFSPIISDFIQDRNIQDEQISILKNSDSFLFNKKEFEIYDEIEEININDNWFILSDNNWKSLDEELKIKINNVLMEIKIQDNIFDFNNDDISFYFLQNEIKKDLINYFNTNISQYYNELITNYNNNQIYNNSYENKEILEIIDKAEVESFYKNKILDSLRAFTTKKKFNKFRIRVNNSCWKIRSREINFN